MNFFITLGDIIGLLIGGLLVLLLVAVQAADAWRKYRCRHLEYFENRACSAICRRCHKDLGFIGTVREERKLAATQPKDTPNV